MVSRTPTDANTRQKYFQMGDAPATTRRQAGGYRIAWSIDQAPRTLPNPLPFMSRAKDAGFDRPMVVRETGGERRLEARLRSLANS